MNSRRAGQVLSVLAVGMLATGLASPAHGDERPVVTVTASDAAMPYGGTLPSVAPSYAGLPDGLTEADLDVAPTCLADPVSGTTSCAGASDVDVDFAYVPGVLSTTPVPLLITASDLMVHEGDPAPRPTPSYTGLVNGDTAPATPPTCVAVEGEWVTRCAGAADGHYTIGYVDGMYSRFQLGPAPVGRLEVAHQPGFDEQVSSPEPATSRYEASSPERLVPAVAANRPTAEVVLPNVGNGLDAALAAAGLVLVAGGALLVRRGRVSGSASP